jgi:hypothetical protein
MAAPPEIFGNRRAKRGMVFDQQDTAHGLSGCRKLARLTSPFRQFR